MSHEPQFIAAINANAGEGDRMIEHVYADWLLDVGQPDLAEAWRVLLEAGKRPSIGLYADDDLWDWFPEGYKKRMPAPSYDALPDDLWEKVEYTRYPTYFAAMNAAAIAWVRCHRDAGFCAETERIE